MPALAKQNVPWRTVVYCSSQRIISDTEHDGRRQGYEVASENLVADTTDQIGPSDQTQYAPPVGFHILRAVVASAIDERECDQDNDTGSAQAIFQGFVLCVIN